MEARAGGFQRRWRHRRMNCICHTVGSHKIHLRKRRRKRKHFFPRLLALIPTQPDFSRKVSALSFFAAASSVTAGRHSGGAKAAALIFGRHCQRCDWACRVTLTDLVDEEAGGGWGMGRGGGGAPQCLHAPQTLTSAHQL